MNIQSLITEAADEAVRKVDEGHSFGTLIKNSICVRILRWQFGEYGWTSPVNLLITAAWTKWLHPDQDVCKIWAKDSKNNPITGGFSLRSADESFTVPLVCRLNIFPGFCSNNSGMQGTRAIEKARAACRIDRDTRLEQRVLFDLELFVNIMNDINDLKSEEAKFVFQYLIEQGYRKKLQIAKGKAALKGTEIDSRKNAYDLVIKAASLIHDPQFIKVLVGSCLDLIAKQTENFHDCTVEGIYDQKTGANARSLAPGDIWLSKNKSPVLGCEVKDASKEFGFEILSAVRERIKSNPTLTRYWLVTASETAIKHTVASDPEWSKQLREFRKSGCIISIFTFRALLALVDSLIHIDGILPDIITGHLVETSDLKNETIAKWNELIK